MWDVRTAAPGIAGDCRFVGHVAVWPDCPRREFVALVEVHDWPPKIAVLYWPDELEDLLRKLADPVWRNSTLGPLGFRCETERARKSGAEGNSKRPWRRTIRIPGEQAHDVPALVRLIAGADPGQQMAATVWFSAGHISSALLADVARLESCLSSQDGRPRPLMLVHGAIDDCETAVIEHFITAPNRTIVPVIDCGDDPGPRVAEIQRRIRALADAGAVLPVELHLDPQDSHRALDACLEWSEASRLAGLLLVPARRAVGISAQEFAQFLLRVYDLELVPSARLFPVNLALAALSDVDVAPMFLSHPLGDTDERISVTTPLSEGDGRRDGPMVGS